MTEFGDKNLTALVGNRIGTELMDSLTVLTLSSLLERVENGVKREFSLSYVVHMTSKHGQI